MEPIVAVPAMAVGVQLVAMFSDSIVILFDGFFLHFRYALKFIRKAPNNESSWNYLQGLV